MECRPACAMCCIAPSIQGAIPGMPGGKAAGEMCFNLDPESLRCRIWGTADYPDFCRQFAPNIAFCGESRAEADQILTFLEVSTSP